MNCGAKLIRLRLAASVALLIVFCAPLSAQTSLTNGVYQIVGSENAPAAFSTPGISLFAKGEGYYGIGNVGTNAVTVDTNFTGVIVDYNFFRANATLDGIESRLNGGENRIAVTNYNLRVAIGGGPIKSTSAFKIWTATDPGTNWSSAPDYGTATGIGTFSNILGFVSIEEMKSGDLYFFHKSYRIKPLLYLTMQDTDGPEPDIVLPAPPHDTANSAEYYMMPFTFENETLAYDTITWEINGTFYSGEPHLDFYGIVLSGPPPPKGMVITLQ